MAVHLAGAADLAKFLLIFADYSKANDPVDCDEWRSFVKMG
jgi:hypothetical protein